jgi:hypothetical protein
MELASSPTEVECSDTEQSSCIVLRVYSKDIRQIWPFIKFGLVDMKPLLADGDPDYVNGVLRGLISNKMQLWASYTEVGENQYRLDGFVITYIIASPSLSGARHLYVYAFYSFGTITMDQIILGQKCMEEFAKESRCSGIRAEVDFGVMDAWVGNLGLGYKKAWVTVQKEVSYAR